MPNQTDIFTLLSEIKDILLRLETRVLKVIEIEKDIEKHEPGSFGQHE